MFGESEYALTPAQSRKDAEETLEFMQKHKCIFFHAVHKDGLDFIGQSGKIEFPSIGITKVEGHTITHFGPVVFVPALSLMRERTTWIFDRDAYTPRWKQFQFDSYQIDQLLAQPFISSIADHNKYTSMESMKDKEIAARLEATIRMQKDLIDVNRNPESTSNDKVINRQREKIITDNIAYIASNITDDQLKSAYIDARKSNLLTYNKVETQKWITDKMNEYMKTKLMDIFGYAEDSPDLEENGVNDPKWVYEHFQRLSEERREQIKNERRALMLDYLMNELFIVYTRADEKTRVKMARQKFKKGNLIGQEASYPPDYVFAASRIPAQDLGNACDKKLFNTDAPVMSEMLAMRQAQINLMLGATSDSGKIEENDNTVFWHFMRIYSHEMYENKRENDIGYYESEKRDAKVKFERMINKIVEAIGESRTTETFMRKIFVVMKEYYERLSGPPVNPLTYQEDIYKFFLEKSGPFYRRMFPQLRRAYVDDVKASYFEAKALGIYSINRFPFVIIPMHSNEDSDVYGARVHETVMKLRTKGYTGRIIECPFEPKFGFIYNIMKMSLSAGVGFEPFLRESLAKKGLVRYKSSNIEVGKRMGDRVYFHAKYAEQVMPFGLYRAVYELYWDAFVRRNSENYEKAVQVQTQKYLSMVANGEITNDYAEFNLVQVRNTEDDRKDLAEKNSKLSEYEPRVDYSLEEVVAATIIRWDRKTGEVGFAFSPDFNTADEPLVGNIFTVVPVDFENYQKAMDMAERNEERLQGTMALFFKKAYTQEIPDEKDEWSPVIKTNVRFRPAPTDREVYHHKWLMVLDGWKGFSVLLAMQRSLKIIERVKPGDMARAGKLSAWKKIVQERGI